MELRPIPGASGYLASESGEIVSERRYEQKTLKACRHSGGYLQVGIRHDDGRIKTRLVHQLVLLAWVGPRPAGAVINHINGDKKDNRLANLEYCSQSQNMAHACRLGLTPKPPRRHGVLAPKAKLNEDEVCDLRREAARGVGLTQLAATYGITTATVSKVVLRRTWRHLP